MTYRLIILALISVFLTACVPPQVSLKEQASVDLNSVDQILVIPQSNLDVTVVASNPGASGLIGALIVAAIDESRRSTAKKEAASIIEELRDYDFRVAMQKVMESEIAATEKLQFVLNTRLETVDSPSSRRINFDQATSDAVLFSTVDYQLRSGNLVLTLKAEIYPKQKSLHKYRNKADESTPFSPGNSMYYKKFTYTKQGVHKANVKEALSEGASSLARQLIRDLAHPV